MGEMEKETEIQWVKHGSGVYAAVFGKDMIALHHGNFISFLETSRPDKKEIVYNASSEVRGDGIQCMCVHKTLSCFAFAEMCRNPRILVVSYPTFEVFKTFESMTDTNYVAIRFSEMEYLVALTGIPDYKIIIWNWRTGEKLCSQESKIEHPHQILRYGSFYNEVKVQGQGEPTSDPVSPVPPIRVLQTTCTEYKLNFWDMNVCYKKTILNRTEVSLPQYTYPPYSFTFGVDGDLYFVDYKGSFYSVSGESHSVTLQMARSGADTTGNYIPYIIKYRGGLVFTIPGKIMFVKRKSPEGWSKIWTFTTKTPFKILTTSSLKEFLVGVTVQNEVVVVKGETQVEAVTVKHYGSDFEFVCFIYPVGDYFITYGNNRKVFISWNKVTGNRVFQLPWVRGRINAVESNPKWPYLAVATPDGKVNVLNVFNPTFFMELDEISLTRDSLDAIRFHNQGIMFCAANMENGEFFLLRVSGKLDVIGYTKISLKIVDFIIIEKDPYGTCLLILPMSQLCCKAGQTILLYALIEKQKSFEYVKDIALPTVITSIVPFPSFHKEVFCIPHRSRHFYLVNTHNGKIVKDYVTGHQMKLNSMKVEGDYIFTYGVDGLVVVKVTESKKCATILATHHRLSKGVKAIAVDPYYQFVVILGGDGSLVCTQLKKIGKPERRADNEAVLLSPFYKQLYLGTVADKSKPKYPGKPGEDALSTKSMESFFDRDKIWTELRKQREVAKEEQEHKKEKINMDEELTNLKNKLKELLDENYSNVPERQLPVQAFDLDKAVRRKKLEDAKAEREKEKQFQIAATKNYNKITDIMKKLFWDSINVKAREVHAILAPFFVQSYALLPDVKGLKGKMTWLEERLKMERFFRKGDFFEPWVPRTDSVLEMHINNKFQVSSLDVTQTIKTKFEEEQMEDEKAKMESEDEKSRYVWTGTSSHNFIDVHPNHYSQFELTTFLQGHQEIQLIQVDIKKLMLWFNKEFLETFALKEREMAVLLERNSRFRHIINELSFFHFSPHICRTIINDPEWAPQENPETLMTVEDHEVKVPMYMSESQIEILKKKEMEEERLRQLMADDFRERALMVMMDGVLEKLWEDEIKKDVPKPKCMIEKEQDAWNEDDLKAVRAYEEAVKFMANERERYRKMLEAEWGKTVALAKDSVNKFDEKVVKLHLLKLKVESAIRQEILKCLRIRERCFQRIALDRKEEVIKSNIHKQEKKMEAMNQELSKLLEMLNDCRTYYELLQNKDKNLDKNFKREFPDYSPIVCEQLYKLSKKRPKLLQKAAIYSTVLNDVGKCAVSGGKPEYLPVECIQYLKDIDALDAHSNAPASVSLQSWELACKMRRTKIDCELKIRACAIDLADAEATVANYQKALKAAKEHHTHLQNELHALRSDKLNSSLNYKIQLVLKKGLVEIPLTGHVSDFNECILVTQDILNEVNKAIQKMGLQKIKAMQKAANFRKGIIYKEWEHKKLRMEIEDLKSQLKTVEKIQVLKELQAILVARARGFPDEKGFLSLENELTGVKEKFEKSQTEIFKEIDNLDMKIQKINLQNEEMDEKITELNVEINEMNLGRDKDFDKKNLASNVRRMKRVRERSHLVRTIQEQHNEILLLQTELELLRLKTYPTIKYKVS